MLALGPPQAFEFRIEIGVIRPGRPARLRLNLPSDRLVNIRIYDLAGRKIADVVHDRLAAGVHLLLWEGNDTGAGLYVVRVEAGEDQARGKLVVVR